MAINNEPTNRIVSNLDAEIAPVIFHAKQLLSNAKLVRFIHFEKSKSQNWSLPWHQDRVIAVKSRVDYSGYNNWTQKSGVWHCEPPIELLENMIFARVYLSDSNVDSGCMKIAIGSHKQGRVKASKIDSITFNSSIEVCEAKAGDVLFIKALALHSSLSSKSEAPRRVLRIDFSNTSLPSSLEWL